MKNAFFGEDYSKRKISTTTNLMFGGIAGCMAATVTYPTDLIRRRYQV
jgi:hypothetical protein